jgi:hypothetical protein
MRSDNSWLYVIGDEKTLYVFSVKYLRKLASRFKSIVTPNILRVSHAHTRRG